MNMRAIPRLAARFHVPVGLSDHTLGISVPIASIALGACIIEKHFTLSRADRGPDSVFSLEPKEFKAMVDGIRTVEKAIGEPRQVMGRFEAKSRVFRRSLFIVQDVKKGELFSAFNVRCIRPGYGLHSRHLRDVIGRRATRNVLRGTPLAWDLVGRRRG
jgi:N-acetylneuraminate synthase